MRTKDKATNKLHSINQNSKEYLMSNAHHAYNVHITIGDTYNVYIVICNAYIMYT